MLKVSTGAWICLVMAIVFMGNYNVAVLAGPIISLI